MNFRTPVRSRMNTRPRGRGHLWPAVAVLFVAALLPAQTSTFQPPPLRDVGIDQRLNEQVPLELPFRDETGETVRLGDYFGKKPVVLSLVYFGCPMLCNMVEDAMLTTLKEINFNVGNQFEVVTVSFDPRDTAEVAAARKRMYAGLYGRPGAAAGWHFLTGDQASIDQLTRAVGFRYSYDPSTRQFAHAAAIMVLTPDGILSHYFYGITYRARDVRLALVEASHRRIGSPADAVLLFCFHYDPMTGKYGLIISRVIAVLCTSTVFGVGLLMAVLFTGERKKRRAP